MLGFPIRRFQFDVFLCQKYHCETLYPPSSSMSSPSMTETHPWPQQVAGRVILGALNVTDSSLSKDLSLHRVFQMIPFHTRRTDLHNKRPQGFSGAVSAKDQGTFCVS